MGGESQDDEEHPALIPSEPRAPEQIVEQLTPLLQPGSEEKALRIVRQSVTQVTSSPLPPAHEMERYERIYPGITKQWLDVAIEDVRHARRLEIDSGLRDYALKKRGQWFGIAALVIGAVLCGDLAHLGHPTQAVALGIGLILIVVLAFIGNEALLVYLRHQIQKDSTEDADS